MVVQHAKGREFYDDCYEDDEGYEDDVVKDRLDFTKIKFHGRQKELKILTTLYHGVLSHSISATSVRNSRKNKVPPLPLSPQVAFITGYSGAGKSTLVQEFVSKIKSMKSRFPNGSKPLFLSGKFADLQGGADPLSAIVEALNGFVSSLLSSSTATTASTHTLHQFRMRLRTIDQEQLDVLTTVVPNLKKVIRQLNKSKTSRNLLMATSSDSDSELELGTSKTHTADTKTTSDTEATTSKQQQQVKKENVWNRLKYAFTMFFKAICTRQNPVILFLDDVQWMDRGSIDLIISLLSDKSLNFLFFIGAMRADESHGKKLITPSATATTAVLEQAQNNSNNLVEELQALEEQMALSQASMSTRSDHGNNGKNIKPFKLVERIELLNLTLTEMNDYISDVLGLDNQETMPFSTTIYSKTRGNIFFTMQALEELHRKNILFYSRISFCWEWNLPMDTTSSSTSPSTQDTSGKTSQILSLENLLSDTVIESVSSKLQSAPYRVQIVLIVAAYTRPSFDVDMLMKLIQMNCQDKIIPFIMTKSSNNNNTKNHTTSDVIRIQDRDELIQILDVAVLEGLLYNTVGSKIYSFAHDRIQQAAYELLSDESVKGEFRRRIGQALYKIWMLSSPSARALHSPAAGEHSSSAFKLPNGAGGTNRSIEDSDWMLFCAVDHINAATDLIAPSDTSNAGNATSGSLNVGSDRGGSATAAMFLTQINLQVGERAAAIGAYEIASSYLQRSLLALQTVKEAWVHHYDITLRVYRRLSDSELCLGRYEQGQYLGRELLKRATSLQDRLPTYTSLTIALGKQEHHEEALKMSQNALLSLNQYPKRSHMVHVITNFIAVSSYLASHSDEQILNLPLIEHGSALEVTMGLLSQSAVEAFYCGNNVGFLVGVLQILRLSFRRGLSGHSSTAFSFFGMVLSQMNKQIQAERAAHLAEQVIVVTGAKELESKTIFAVAHFITAWTKPHAEILEIYKRSHILDMEIGDYEHGYLSWCADLHHAYSAGYPLQNLDKKYCEMLEQCHVHNLASVRAMGRQQHCAIQHLTGSAEGCSTTTYNEFTPNWVKLGEFEPVTFNRSETYPLIFGYLSRLEIGVYFGEYKFAESMAHKLNEVSGHESAYCTTTHRLYFSALSEFGVARQKDAMSSSKRRKHRNKGRKYMKELQWHSNNKGLMSWHRVVILKAEFKAIADWDKERRHFEQEMKKLSQGQRAIKKKETFATNHNTQNAEMHTAERTTDESCKNISSVRKKYNIAIRCAIHANHPQDAALCCELAGEHYLSIGDELTAKDYLVEARDWYLEWGATTKVSHLTKKRGDLIASTAPRRRRGATEASESEMSVPTTTSFDLDLISGVSSPGWKLDCTSIASGSMHRGHSACTPAEDSHSHQSDNESFAVDPLDVSNISQTQESSTTS